MSGCWIAVASTIALGCGGPRDRCDELVKRTDDLIRRNDLPVPAGERDRMLATCRIELAEAPDCLDDANRKTPRCQEVHARALDRADPPRRLELGWRTETALDNRITVLVPGAWQRVTNDIGQLIYATTSTSGGGATSMSVRVVCEGSCTSPAPASAWAELAERRVAQHGADAQRVKDVALDAGRLVMWSRPLDERRRFEIEAWFWQDGGSLMYECRAEVDRRASANLDDFEKACRSLAATRYAL